MNTLRMISRVATIIAITVVGNVYTLNLNLKDPIKSFMIKNRHAMIAVGVGSALPKDCPGAKASLHAFGYILDQGKDVDILSSAAFGALDFALIKYGPSLVDNAAPQPVKQVGDNSPVIVKNASSEVLPPLVAGLLVVGVQTIGTAVANYKGSDISS